MYIAYDLRIYRLVLSFRIDFRTYFKILELSLGENKGWFMVWVSLCGVTLGMGWGIG